jgi:predicted acyltransferase
MTMVGYTPTCEQDGPKQRVRDVTLAEDAGFDRTPVAPASQARVGALDALRGIAVGLMVFVNLRGSNAMPAALQHSAWNGLTVADTVFPMFLFALGASLALASRTTSVRHAALRSLKLAALGALLAALWRWQLPRPAFGVLPHIAAASLLASLLLRWPPRRQPIAVAMILAALAIAGALSGWGRNTAWGVRLDRQFLGGFTPEGPQSWPGSVASIWFGVVAGRIAITHTHTARRLRLAGLGAALLVAGSVMATVIPVNKALWTPSFALLGAGIAALVFTLLDSHDRATGVLRLLGANPIAAYLFAESILWAIRQDLWFPVRGTLEPVIGVGAAALLYPSLALGVTIALCSSLRRHHLRLSL